MLTTLRQWGTQAGFTMIELLVVIAVIGVLAVAVLSSINPIEQINKGRDTRSRSDAAQLVNAVDRYFSIHERYPWNETVTGGSLAGDTVDYAPVQPTTTDYSTPFTFDEGAQGVTIDSWGWLVKLVETAEVKDSFTARLADVADNTDFYILKANGRNETMYTCFTPASKAFEQEANDRCNPASDDYDAQMTGAVPAACADHAIAGATDGVSCYTNSTDDDVCYVCVP